MNNARKEIRLSKALKKLIDKQPNSSKWCREAMWEKLEREKKECYYCLRKTFEGKINKKYDKFMCIACLEKYKR